MPRPPKPDHEKSSTKVWFYFLAVPQHPDLLAPESISPHRMRLEVQENIERAGSSLILAPRWKTSVKSVREGRIPVSRMTTGFIPLEGGRYSHFPPVTLGWGEQKRMRRPRQVAEWDPSAWNHWNQRHEWTDPVYFAWMIPGTIPLRYKQLTEGTIISGLQILDAGRDLGLCLFCGRETIIGWRELLYGKVRSCGCLSAERKSSAKHTPVHSVWLRWRRRGLLCDEWRASEARFWKWCEAHGWRPGAEIGPNYGVMATLLPEGALWTRGTRLPALLGPDTAMIYLSREERMAMMTTMMGDRKPVKTPRVDLDGWEFGE